MTITLQINHTLHKGRTNLDGWSLKGPEIDAYRAKVKIPPFGKFDGPWWRSSNCANPEANGNWMKNAFTVNPNYEPSPEDQRQPIPIDRTPYIREVERFRDILQYEKHIPTINREIVNIRRKLNELGKKL